MAPADFPTDEDIAVLYEALAYGEGRDVEPEEVTPLVFWVDRALKDAALAQLLLDGRVVARLMPDGQFAFRMPQPGEAPTL
jgi:hypothetical protein